MNGSLLHKNTFFYVPRVSTYDRFPVLRIPDKLDLSLKLYLFTNSSVGRKEITINKTGGQYGTDLTRTQTFFPIYPTI